MNLGKSLWDGFSWHKCSLSDFFVCLFLVVKKKGTTGLKLSNLMNLGRKKSSSMDSPERSLETSSKWQHKLLCRDLSQGWTLVCSAG